MSALLLESESRTSSLLRLCPMCQTLTSVVDEWTGHYRTEVDLFYYTHPERLLRSIETPCPICIRLFYKMEEFHILDKEVRTSNTSDLPSNRNKNVVRGLYSTQSGGFLYLHAIIHQRPALDLNLALAPRQTCSPKNFDISTGAPGPLAFAKEWIKRCVNSHPQCNVRLSDEVPARLLELDLDSEAFRLRIVSEMQSSPRYATLSHCWGKIEMFKLKMNNIHLLCNWAPTSQLCKTFRDAIQATLSFDLKYLWIDSLCIIQDNEEDWGRGSVRMSAVYGNAVVNLAATNSADGNGGLFFKRDVLRSTSPTFQTAKGRLYGFMDDYQFLECIEFSPLSKRAWAFQERYLAQRTVHFGSEQIFCQCSQHTASESWPEGFPTDAGKAQYRSASIPKAWKWHDLVQVYSEGQLTFAKDKLVALSGVARYFQKSKGDQYQYAAGLWRENLEAQLMWHATGAMVPKDLPIPGKYVAPSWSWASSDRPVTWGSKYLVDPADSNQSLTCLIHIKDVKVQSNGSDALGSLRDARLQICGTLFSSIIEACAASNERMGGKVIFRSMNKVPLEAMGTISYDRSEHDNDKVKYILPIFEEFQETSFPQQIMSVHGLVLAPADGKEKGCFRRVGVFAIWAEWEHYGQLLKSLTREDSVRPWRGILKKMLKSSAKIKEPVGLWEEPAFGEAISNEEMHRYESMRGFKTERIKFYDQGMKFYNITLV